MTNIQTLRDIENHLLKDYATYSSRKPLNFVLMYDEESGCNIGFVKDMRIKQPSLQNDRKSTRSCNHANRDVQSWKYSGFVRKGFFGVQEPITTKQLKELLNHHNYSEKDFIKSFLHT